MKLHKVVLLLGLFDIQLSFAEIKCPICNSLNNDDDRYCINCATEIRAITQEEKSRIEKQKLFDSLNKTYSIEIGQKTVTEKTIESKTNNSTSQRSDNIISGKNINYCLKRSGIKIKLGKSKQSFKNDFKFKNGVYELDQWSFHFKLEKVNDFFCTILFKDNTVSGWEMIEKIPFHIQRDFPLSEKDLKKGMSYYQVMCLWGYPDIKEETNSYTIYSLKISYYIQEPTDEGLGGITSEKTKEGPIIELIFDEDRKLQSFSQKIGEKILCSNKNSTIYPKTYRVPKNENDEY